MIAVKTTVDVDLYTLASNLCSGMEGGIGYWATIVKYREPKALDVTLDRLSNAHFAKLYPGNKPSEERVYRHIDYALNPGGGVLLQENDRDLGKYWLTFPKLKRALALMARDYPHHFADVMNDTGDATTGDVLVQLAVFGEVVYG